MSQLQSGMRLAREYRACPDDPRVVRLYGAAEVVKKHGDVELSGVNFPTPTNQCWPEPVPYILSKIALLMLQQPDKIGAQQYPSAIICLHAESYTRWNQHNHVAWPPRLGTWGNAGCGR